MNRIVLIAVALLLSVNLVAAEGMSFNRASKKEAAESVMKMTSGAPELKFDDVPVGHITGQFGHRGWKEDLSQILGPSYRWYMATDGKVHVTTYDKYLVLLERSGNQQTEDPATAVRDERRQSVRTGRVVSQAYQAPPMPLDEYGNPDPYDLATARRNIGVIPPQWPILPPNSGGGHYPQRNVYGRGYSNCAYDYNCVDPVSYRRRVTKQIAKETHNDARLLGDEGLLSKIEVYLNGSWQGRANDYNSRIVDGTLAVEEGENILYLINLETNTFVRRTIDLRPRAIREAFGQGKQDLRVDDLTFKHAKPWDGETTK